MKSLKPKIIVGTPIRSRENSQQGTLRTLLTPSKLGKENSAVQPEEPKDLSPNKNLRRPTLTNKPNIQYNTVPVEPSRNSLQIKLLKPVYKNNMLSSRKKECANHPEKEAEFRITIEGESMLYCAKCSAHLASQGFTLEKLNDKPMSKINPPSTPINLISERQESTDPSLSGHPRHNEIVEFLKKIENVASSLRQNNYGFLSLSQHYKDQHQLLSEFYDAMLYYMKHVKAQHLSLIKNEQRKYVQIGDIEMGEINDNLAELDCIVTDIKDNMNSIVREITEDKYRECFNFYFQKVELYRHRVYEQRETLGEVTEMGKGELEGKLQEFRWAVNEMFGIKEVAEGRVGGVSMGGNPLGNPGNTHNPPISQGFKALPQNSQPSQPKKPQAFMPSKPANTYQAAQTVHHASQPANAFRNLFEYDDGMGCHYQRLPDQSPQFKNI